MTTEYIQTPDQRHFLREQLLAKAGGNTVGDAYYITLADLVGYGVNDLGYPEELVRVVIRELQVQNLLPGVEAA